MSCEKEFTFTLLQIKIHKMEQLQKQVDQIENALKTQQTTQNMKIENNEIKQNIKIKNMKSKELQNLVLLAIHGICLLGEDTDETDKNVLSSLSNLKEAKALKDVEQNEKQTDSVGMLLQKVLREVVNTVENSKGTANVMDLYKCEQQLVDLFYYAEEERIIPGVPENTNWKAQYNEHKKRII